MIITDNKQVYFGSQHLRKMSRFGTASMQEIDKSIEDLTPENTKRSKNSIWKQFEEFCSEKKYVLEAQTTPENLANILKDWASNMRRKDGSFYKESVVKTMWNVTAKLLQQKYSEYGVNLDPFTNITFKAARDARDAVRRELQGDPSKRRTSSSAFTSEEYLSILKLFDENTPDGLQKKLFHVLSFELAFRGGEAPNCTTDFFKMEKFHDGTPTNRIEYNPIFSKTRQGGSHLLTDSKWLIKNNADEAICPIR